MTLLEKTYQILQQDNKSITEREWQKPTRPTKDFTIKPFNIPVTRKINPQRVLLSKVLAFIDMKKQIRFSDGFTVLPISCKSKRLLSMFDNQHQQVSRFIDFMIFIGLLGEYDESYQFNAYYQKDNRIKQYIYSYNTEELIKEYCIQNSINKYVIKNYTIHNNSAHIQTIDNFDKSSVRFSSKLNLLKPDNWSVHQFEEYLTACLYENYPQLQHYQELADLINEVFYEDDVDRQIHFTPNFTWRKGNKCVIKIGIRATNCMVAATKEKVLKNGESSHLTKEDVLKKYDLKWDFDVKSSVPRVTYLMNNGIWLDNDVDLYQIMYTHFAKYCPSEKMEWNDKTREIFKSFHMRGYFDTETQLAAHLKRQISMKTKYNKNDWRGMDYVMKSYQNAIIDTIGELEYDSEIFFHESCIYMDVLFDLLTKDYKVWQCYDCWYTDKEVKGIEEIVCDKALKYYRKLNNTK